jgi:hypothetical protein
MGYSPFGVMRLKSHINKAPKLRFGRPAHKSAESWNKPGKPVKIGKYIINITFKW